MIRAAIIACFAVLMSFDALAQNCMQSFNVKPNKPLLTYDWLPGKPAGAQTLSCVAAERLREKIYIGNKDLFENVTSGDAAHYIATAEEAVKAAEVKVKELETKVQAGEAGAGVLLVLEVLVYELGKAELLINCIVPEAIVSKIFCGGAFIGLGLQTYRIVNGSITNNEAKQYAEGNKKLLAGARTNLQELKSKLKSSDMAKVKQNNIAMFNGLCQAIRKDCL